MKGLVLVLVLAVVLFVLTGGHFFFLPLFLFLPLGGFFAHRRTRRR